MVDTITPVVHGGKRGPYLRTVLLHVLGATTAAALVGLVLGAVGMLVRPLWPPSVRVGIVAGLALLYLLREAFQFPVPIPDRHKQVPEWWRTFYSPPVTAVLYGLGLGVGFFTYLTFGTFVVVAGAAFVVGEPVTGILLCAPFGLARGLAVVVAARPGDPVDELERIAATPVPRVANAFVLALVAGAAALVLAA